MAVKNPIESDYYRAIMGLIAERSKDGISVALKEGATIDDCADLVVACLIVSAQLTADVTGVVQTTDLIKGLATIAHRSMSRELDRLIDLGEVDVCDPED